jgi:iturin family lipopeptide synthetase A
MNKKLFQPSERHEAAGNNIQLARISSSDIAIIGMAGQLPMAEGLDAYWDNISAGRDCVGALANQRLAEAEKLLTAFSEHTERGRVEFKEKGYLKEIDTFDYKFFNLSYKEACVMNPAQRLFLQAAWQAIDDANHPHASLRGSRTGVFLGYTGSINNYYDLVCATEPALAGMAYPSNLAAVIAGRIAYMLDLKGPAFLVDTACSSSMVAFHLACQSIRSGECDMALTGSVHLSLLPLKSNEEGVGKSSVLGRIRSFDDSADGVVGGEGCVAVLLKPLAKAMADHDNIVAVVKGSASNQDGNSVGITAPNVLAQEEVIQQCWKQGGIDPETVSYWEAHGTGTKLGDPIEVDAITRAFRKFTTRKQFCALGSVKANIGHLDAAAGIAGIVKTALALQHKMLPPQIHFDKPNLRIHFEESPLYINDKLTPWENFSAGPRRAGVSSFGMSGTNCHVVLEEAPPVKPASPPDRPLVLCLSAKSEWALLEKIKTFSGMVGGCTAAELADICYSANCGKDHFPLRVALLAADGRQLAEKLARLLATGLGAEAENGSFLSANLQTAGSARPGSAGEQAAQKGAQLNQEAQALVGEMEAARAPSLMPVLCRLYVQGAEINWRVFYRNEQRNKVRLPLYPLEKKRCWVEYSAKAQPVRPASSPSVTTPLSQPNAMMTTNPKETNGVLHHLKKIVGGVFEITPEEVNEETSFLEMGLDSISIIQVKQLAKNEFSIDIPVEKLFGEVSSIRAMAAYIERLVPALPAAAAPSEPVVPGVALSRPGEGTVNTPAPEARTPGTPAPEGVFQVIQAQMQLMEKQLVLLKEAGAPAVPALLTTPVPPPVPAPLPVPAPQPRQAARPDSPTAAFNPFQQLTSEQEDYLNRLVWRFNQRTKRSKRLVQDNRRWFANNRNTAYYMPLLKELMYPVLAEKASGARFQDVDGNEYLDLSMGFGVFLMGYTHPLISQAIVRQASEGIFLGPMSALPHEVAQLITELTGTERVAFYNSGTEAVMVALRLARAATGKTKIVVFSGSYHGSYDGVLVQKDLFSKGHQAAPKSTGIPPKMLEDVLLLDYGTDESLEVIRQHAHELAAVLVEPVQSRRPEFQPAAFLKALRQLTLDTAVPLIFDEIICGFRIAPGGAQEWFGVQADLVTYGKIAGGGMPIGIVAGKAAFMHGVDGGADWQYGDDSHPKFDHRKTFVAGTFCHHPLAMVAARAMLRHLKAEGPALQQQLNAKTAELAGVLNGFFEEQALPVRLVHFGSLFQIRSEINLILFYCLLQQRGIYVWEGLTLFLSTAHTDADVQTIIQQFKESIFELQRQGFLPGQQHALPAPQTPAGPAAAPGRITIPLTDEQKRIWMGYQLDGSAAEQFHSKRLIELPSAEPQAVIRAFETLMRRHTILQTVAIEEDVLTLDPSLAAPVTFHDAAGWSDEQRQALILKNRNQAFSLHQGPFFRVHLIRKSGGGYLLQFVIHHLIADGWSLNVIFDDLAQLYQPDGKSVPALLPPAAQFSEYVEWLTNYFDSEPGREAEAYWKERFARQTSRLHLQPDPVPAGSGQAGSYVLNFSDSQARALKAFGKQQGASTFMVILALYQVLLYRVSGMARLAIGIPTAGQLQMENKALVGQCVLVLPFIMETDEATPFSAFLAGIKQAWIQALQYRNFSLGRLLDADEGQPLHIPDIRIGFNVDAPVRQEETGAGKTPENAPVSTKQQQGSAYDLFLSVSEDGEGLRLLFQYRHAFASPATMGVCVGAFQQLLEEAIAAPQLALKDMRIDALNGLSLPPAGTHHAAEMTEEDEWAAGDFAASNAEEVLLIALFRKLTGTRHVGGDSHFFRIGGSSLKAIQLISLINKKTGVRLDLRTLFRAPTVNGLAAVLRQSGKLAYQEIAQAPLLAAYPVSHAQKRLWILEQMEENRGAYHMPRAYVLEGALDEAALGRAFDCLVQRHEILRTTFHIADGQLVQQVQPWEHRCFRMALQDLRMEPAKEQKALEIAQSDAVMPFDLAAGPLLRVTLLQLEDTRRVFLLNIHHIVSDGWSMQILVNEILTLYKAFRQGDENPLAPLRIQYKDFTYWQQHHLQDASLEEHRQYWLKRFETLSPVMDLPADHPRPRIKTFRGSKKTYRLADDMALRIRRFCQEREATLIMGLQAAVKGLLYRYTGSADQTIGMAMAGRDHSDLENQIGFYVNTVPLRTVFSGGESFETLLEKVRETMFEAYQHQIYPFDQLIEALHLARDLSRSPLFDVMVELSTIDIAGDATPKLEGITVGDFLTPAQTSKYDLSVRFHDEGDGLFMTIEYNSDLFEPGRIDQLCEHLQGFALAGLARPQAPLAELDFMTPAERAEIHRLSAGPACAWPDAHFLALFARQAAARPDATALSFQGKTLSYRALDEASNQLGRHLKNTHGLGPEQVAGVLADRSADTVIALLAIMKTGAAFLPIDPAYATERKSYLLGDAGVKVLLTESQYLLELIESYQGALFALDLQLDGLTEDNGALESTGQPGDLAYLIYTSGSTGTPKGVEITNGNFVNYLRWANTYYFGDAGGWTFPLFTSLSFDLTLTCVFTTLLRGDCLVVYPGLDAGRTLAEIFAKDSGINAVKLTPAHISLLGRLGLPATGVRKAIIGGEKLTAEQVAVLRQLNPGMELYNEYGPTETTVGCTVKRVKDAGDITIGRPISNTAIYVVGPGGGLLPAGLAGELLIGGAGVARGYRNQPQLTAGRFLPDPFGAVPGGRVYRSGDRGRWTAEGELEFLGRADEQVKVNGYRVEPGEIESVLLEHPAVTQAVVLLAGNAGETAALAAYYTGREETETSLRAYLLRKLPQYMVPARVLFVADMPLTANGKVDRETLLALKGSRSSDAGYVPPRNAFETKLVAIWEQVLHRQGVGITDNYFSIGGNSLNATQVLASMHKELNVTSTLSFFFANPTIAEMVERIHLEDGPEYEQIEPVATARDYIVSPSQERMWFLDQMNQESRSAFKIPVAYQVSGELNLPALENALEALIRRHESLRTTILMQDGELRQQVHPYESLDFRLAVFDLQNESDQAAAIDRLLNEQIVRPFSLTDGPLIRMCLLRLEAQEYILQMVIHHIVADGWSIKVLSRELGILYEGFALGQPPALPSLEIQYRDYAAWVGRLLTSHGFNPHQHYWQRKLADLPGIANFTPDFPQTGTPSLSGSTLKFYLDECVTERLKAICIDSKASLFMVLTTVIKLLLYRHTWSTDIVIGAPIAGRVRKELEGQIGYYINTLALRTSFSSQDSFGELLEKVKKTTLEAYQYQLYPFDKIVEEVSLRKKAAANALFNVGFAWQNFEEDHEPAPELGPLRWKTLERSGSVALHQVWFFGSEIDGKISIRLRYNTSLYLESTIRQLKDDFVQLCLLIAARAPSVPVQEFAQALIPKEKQISDLLDVALLNASLSEEF